MNGKGQVIGEIGADREVTEALRALDPELREPGYWFRFREAVLSAAAGELARRRMMRDLTVSDVVARWSRMVVPTAFATAAAALILMFQTSETSLDMIEGPVSLEELVLEELDPALTAPVETPQESVEVLLAAAIF